MTQILRWEMTGGYPVAPYKYFLCTVQSVTHRMMSELQRMTRISDATILTSTRFIGGAALQRRRHFRLFKLSATYGYSHYQRNSFVSSSPPQTLTAHTKNTSARITFIHSKQSQPESTTECRHMLQTCVTLSCV